MSVHDALSMAGSLQRAGRFDQADAVYRDILEQVPAQFDALHLRGVLAHLRGDHERAIALIKGAIAVKADFPESHFNLGVVLTAAERPAEAAQAYRQALKLRPNYSDAHRGLVSALEDLDDDEDAANAVRAWLQACPDDPLAQHTAASYSGDDVPPHASSEYVRLTFDEFADTYDAELASRRNQGPRLISCGLVRIYGAATASFDMVDAGCGTGLLGPIMRPFARTLIGIDLSTSMLARAKERACYDELACAELTGFLRSHPDRFDTVVSSDALVFFGDLQRPFSAAAAALKPGGWLLATLQQADGTDRRFILERNGMYSHSQRYVRHTLTVAGLRIRFMLSDTLRKERGVPVLGIVAGAQKELPTQKG